MECQVDLFKFSMDTCPCWAPLIPCFGLLVTSPLDFKGRVGGGVRDVRSLRCPVDLYHSNMEIQPTCWHQVLSKK